MRATCLFLFCVAASAQVNRVVIIKVDGLPESLLERYVSERADGAKSGHSRLPWTEHIFEKNGVWMDNFYVRGLSLSSPSWSMLDTGRHLEIRGNAEYDRYTLRVYDYMNFFPFYVGYAENTRADMPGVDLLDDNGIPLLIDSFGPDERYQSFQLLQRGVRWHTLQDSLENAFRGNPRTVFDELITGFPIGSSVTKQTERELLQKLNDPRVRYLDIYLGDYDHMAHLTNDGAAQFHVIEELDALMGRVWTAIQASPLASTTMLVLVSDHGMNTTPGVYSQGYSLIDWFNSSEGGAQHVLTNRYPLTEFKLKGLDPFVSAVATPSAESTYLAGEGNDYPTVAMDLDGNERASIGLRNNSLNIIHILLDQLAHKKLTGRARHAVIDALFQTLDRVRPVWMREVRELSDEMITLRTSIAREKVIVDKLPKQWTLRQRDLEGKREAEHLDRMRVEEEGYSRYVTTVQRLLALSPADFDLGRIKITDLIPVRSLGDPNSVHELQKYVTGPSTAGMVVAEDGSLDWKRSFRYVDYFAALSSIQVRNNVQKDVGSRPVDFIAAPLKNAVWLWRSPERQALIETRHNPDGELELHYLPVAHLSQDEAGELHYDRAAWSQGFPLELFEDPNLGASRGWLDEWHTDHEWLQAVHGTKYSNGIVGIVEALLSDPVADSYLQRKRELRGVDMIVFANDHWNFNVRGFNPGGNHGSFLQVSTHSVLLFAGGDETGIPRGLRVETPYDSLSFAPTVLSLMGKTDSSMPGPLIRELAGQGAYGAAARSAEIGK